MKEGKQRASAGGGKQERIERARERERQAPVQGALKGVAGMAGGRARANERAGQSPPAGSPRAHTFYPLDGDTWPGGGTGDRMPESPDAK